MRFTAAFVEYLVTGCCALLWIVPLLWPVKPCNISSPSTGTAVLLLPILYALGGIIDFVSYFLVLPIRNEIRKGAKRLSREYCVRKETEIFLEERFPSLTAAILDFSPELGKELVLRKTRVRIARGALLNLILLSFVLAIRKPSWLPLNAFHTASIAVLIFLAWATFEYLKQRFKFNAFLTLQRRSELNVTE